MEVIVFTADYRLSKCYSDSTFATKHQPIYELYIAYKMEMITKFSFLLQALTSSQSNYLEKYEH